MYVSAYIFSTRILSNLHVYICMIFFSLFSFSFSCCEVVSLFGMFFSEEYLHIRDEKKENRKLLFLFKILNMMNFWHEAHTIRMHLRFGMPLLIYFFENDLCIFRFKPCYFRHDCTF